MEKTKKNNYLDNIYVVNSQTMLLEPIIENGKRKTTVYEKDKASFVVPHDPQEIIQHSCHYFLSSYEGRKHSTKVLTNIRHKPPIVIDPVTSVYFFSTHSDTNDSNRWLSLQHLQAYASDQKDITRVTLSGGEEVNLPVSVPSFVQQFLKASHLYSRAQFNFDEIREQTESSYSIEQRANRLLFLEYFDRLERSDQSKTKRK
ncbi:competence protein ComK [Jeotgalibacillus soli]|uniref:Competence protein ComK n=1 Tax=Jeotgalibacillus soli TaxID=889306 RepID=A0A0C2RV63_9BACL|nr:competence protein ComK [Jeotgalibacillus soli]KIL45634.1 hypothetical protein KP78_19830 [Jeotgalibacillus soli]